MSFHMMESETHNRVLRYNTFCRMISFTVFSNKGRVRQNFGKTYM